MLNAEAPDYLLTRSELTAYFARISLSLPIPPPPTLATLTALQKAHYLSIPFESLSIHFPKSPPSPTSLPINPSLPSIIDKIIHNNRGGYCFENNVLFLSVLNTLKFTTRLAFTRSYYNGGWLGPSHAVVLVRPHDAKHGSDVYMCDVGFFGLGKFGPPVPVPFNGDIVDSGPHGSFRLSLATSQKYPYWADTAFGDFGEWGVPPFHVLEFKPPKSSDFSPMYGFTTAPVNYVDVRISNFFSCLHPDAWAVNKCIVAKRMVDGGLIYYDGQVLTYVNGVLVSEKQVGSGVGEREWVLLEEFGLDVNKPQTLNE